VTELSDEQLDWVAGGRKAGGEQMEFMPVKMEDILISSYSP
jgi:type VI protein secretion system component Hcp